MNKTTKTVLIILAVLAALLLSFFVSSDKGYKKISYDNYKKLSESAIVYIGNSDEVLKNFKDYDIDEKYSVKYLDSSKLKDDKKDKEIVEIWENSKLVKSYSFDTFKLKEGEKASEVKEVDIDTYNKVKDSEGFHFMLVGRDTCSYCQMFNEAINELYKEYKVEIDYLNTDKLDEAGYNKLVASDEFFEGQWGTPTSLFYYNGERIDIINGYIPKEQLESKLNNVGLLIFLKENKVVE